MNTKLLRSPDLATMIASVSKADFGQLLLAYVSTPGKIRNLGGFFWRSISQQDATVSLWAGEVSEYRLRRSSSRILSDPNAFEEMQEAILETKDGERKVSFLRPTQGDPRRRVIEKLGIRERLSVVTRSGDSALVSFYLRSEKDGPISEEELSGFNEILPIAHELVSLRHKIVGSDAFLHAPGTSFASLRERCIEPFVKLSDREVEICDGVVAGQTAEATALELGLEVTSIRTLRRRAYAKLNVNSTTQLLSLIIKDNSQL